jgi:hypothetical protein
MYNGSKRVMQHATWYEELDNAFKISGNRHVKNYVIVHAIKSNDEVLA